MSRKPKIIVLDAWAITAYLGRVDVDWKLTQSAALLIAWCRMFYADCYAAALAKEEKAELVTGDGEFKQVEGDVKLRLL